MRVIYITIILVFVGLLISLPITFVQISSQSQGLIRSKSDNTSLTSIVSGQVAYIKIQENSSIYKNDTLLIIDNLGIQTKKTSNYQSYAGLIQQINDLDYLLSGRDNITRIKTSLYQKKLQQYKQERDELLLEFRQRKIEYERNNSLYQDGVLAEMEFLVFKNNFDNVKARLDKLASHQQANWQIEKKAIQERILDIRTEIQQLQNEQKSYFILAPFSGTILNYDGTQKGSFVSAGQTIAQIAPDDSMIVECYVAPKDIGFIKKDQTVKFQVHAFNYNQWGLATGKVLDIDKNLNVQQNGSPFFRVRCSLDTPYLQLNNGYKGHLIKGITLTARFAIAERSLYQLLFDKMDDWFNPKMVD